MTLSVAIITYNDRGWLREAIASCVSQGVADQVFVVDNGTTTCDVRVNVREWFGSEVEVLRLDGNRECVGGMNTAIDYATGDWLHILHDDDLSLPGHHAAIKEADRHADCVAYWCREHVIDAAGNIQGQTRIWSDRAGPLYASPWVFLCGANPVCFPGMAVRTRVLREVRFSHAVAYCPDLLTWGRVAMRGGIWYDPIPRVCYRRHRTGEQQDGEAMRVVADMLRDELLTRRGKSVS